MLPAGVRDFEKTLIWCPSGNPTYLGLERRGGVYPLPKCCRIITDFGRA